MSDIDRREALRRTAMLIGGALSAPAVAGVLAGAGDASVWAQTSRPGWTPRALSADQLELVATVAEHMIPTTDTPGARAAGVHRFIDTMLAEYYTSAERQDFIAGLADLDARARTAAGRTFLHSDRRQQRTILDAVDREAFPGAENRGAADVAKNASKETERGGGGTVAATESRLTKRHYFRTMKELVILGYYTSQIGATKELHYQQVPGRFDGCVPLAKIGRAWAV
jgi:hypothetical protein